jgi:beta-glucanase (GH16 family)
MKKIFLAVVTALPVLAAQSGKLAWRDEFNGPRNAPPDPLKWTYDLGDGGWGNRELEVYTKSPENVFQDGHGHLVIRAVKTNSGQFTSARLKTQGKFSVTYGTIAARMRIPRGQGLWPAFWMLGQDIGSAGWPKCGEIDVMENIGREPGIVHGTVHGPGYSGKGGISARYALPNGKPLFDKFHVYAVKWSPGRIQFSLDGRAYATVTPASLPQGTEWVYNHPFFLLLNLAVGGAWPGNPDRTTQFPQELLVDWVRVWK